jgi:hypothetical protein
MHHGTIDRKTASGLRVRSADDATADVPPVYFGNTGTVVWRPAPGYIASSCVSDGRSRWILHFDPFPGAGAGELIGLPDGSVVGVVGADVVRLSDEGAIVAQRDARYTYVTHTFRGDPIYGVAVAQPIGGAQDCGVLAVHSTEDAQVVVEWWDSSTLAVTGSRAIDDGVPDSVEDLGLYPASPWLLADCAVLVGRIWSDPGSTHATHAETLVRTRDGSNEWISAAAPGPGVFPLDDGGYVTTMDEGILRIFDRAGVLTYEHDYSSELGGVGFARGGQVLMPDGVLYAGTAGLLSTRLGLAAIALGAGPAPYAWQRSAGGWSRAPVMSAE